MPAVSSVTAAVDVPPFANSSMDGFALRAADAPGELRAGRRGGGRGRDAAHVGPGTTVRIMTGAPMPPGADAVVPLEEAEMVGDDRVRLPVTEAGAYVRARGQRHTRAGRRSSCAVEPLLTAAIAVLASLGLGQIAVRRRPRVAILSTGDELMPPGEPLGAGPDPRRQHGVAGRRRPRGGR